jgi:S-methylmethionine-dependent homocysteine/selenocysteine methylase
MHGPGVVLPQLGDGLFITDGGIETTLIFQEGWQLPHFAAFHLLRLREGEAALRRYFDRYVDIARRFATGLVLESATWRANRDWGALLGYSDAELARANRQALRLLHDVRAQHASATTPMVVSGCIGPRGDGYVPGRTMTADQAEAYHQEQVDGFVDAGADMVCAITMSYAHEAAGIAHAARKAHVPVAISFTVETDGKLPTGQPLSAAIGQVDDATAGYPAYYMINCAHPDHFAHVLDGDDERLARVRGIRANASTKSHAELNDACALDAGDPIALGAHFATLRARHPRLTVMGGCCGTDTRHIEEIAKTCAVTVHA